MYIPIDCLICSQEKNISKTTAKIFAKQRYLNFFVLNLSGFYISVQQESTFLHFQSLQCLSFDIIEGCITDLFITLFTYNNQQGVLLNSSIYLWNQTYHNQSDGKFNPWVNIGEKNLCHGIISGFFWLSFRFNIVHSMFG